jgi:hypothetical protein
MIKRCKSKYTGISFYPYRAGGVLMILSGLPGISGMVKVAANRFLVVHDTKGPVGPWLGAIDIEKDGHRYREIAIHDWPSSEAPPNDLEGICAIADHSGEYLVVESGFYPKYGDFGRVIKIGYEGGTALCATYLGAFRPFPRPKITLRLPNTNSWKELPQ